MQAIQLLQSIPRYALTKALGRLYRPIFWSRLAMLQYRAVPEPVLPGPAWVKIRTRYGGICGSDLHTIALENSPALSVFTSFPFTLGHEGVGTIVEAGPQAGDFRPGERVVVEGLLPCAARDIAEPCAACLQGEFSRCHNFAEGLLAPGMSIGACRDTGGSWGPYFVAHHSQLFRVPAQVSDESAVLVDAFASALHGVLLHLPAGHETALILGAGVIGLCTIAALRAAGSRARILVSARYPFQAEMARQLGASEIIHPEAGGLERSLARATGGKLYRPLLGREVLVGGADVIYECIGSARSLNDSLRLTRPGGAVVLVGLASTPSGVDWTPIWLKELAVQGSVWCGTETFQGRRMRTFQLALDWLAEGRIDLAPLLTHRFRLEDYAQAFLALTRKGHHHIIKAVFAFDQS
jgi:threonine dehydrogenase-like Zn-dependent dehydrogenase